MITPNPQGVTKSHAFRYDQPFLRRRRDWSIDPKGQRRVNRVARAVNKALDAVANRHAIREMLEVE